MPMQTLDHLVVAVPDLAAAMEEFSETLGAPFVVGGRHPHRGTHNALLNLGQGAYLELIAPDPTNTAVAPPRWMGVDLITQPTLTRWALKASPLAKYAMALAAYRAELAEVQGGERETPEGKCLRWQLTVPLPSPQVEVAPFLIDWSASEQHPTDSLAPAQCQVVQLRILHPEPDRVNAVLASLSTDWRAEWALEPRLQATLRCPRGEITI